MLHRVLSTIQSTSFTLKQVYLVDAKIMSVFVLNFCALFYNIISLMFNCVHVASFLSVDFALLIVLIILFSVLIL